MNLPPDEPKRGAPEWVVTFGDMMALLLCFFVLLLSFSTMELEKFKVVAGYIKEAFGVQTTTRHTEVPAGETVVAVEFHEHRPGCSRWHRVVLGRRERAVHDGVRGGDRAGEPNDRTNRDASGGSRTTGRASATRDDCPAGGYHNCARSSRCHSGGSAPCTCRELA